MEPNNLDNPDTPDTAPAPDAAPSPGRATGQIMTMLFVVVAGVALAGVVPLGFKTGIIAAAVAAAVKALWPLQADVDALLSYNPDE